MRSLSCVAIAAAALTTIACGSPATESGNSYVTEQALEGVEVGTDAFRVIPVAVDSEDPGCSVDGVRFNSCTVVNDSRANLAVATNLCELQVGAGTRYFVDCEMQKNVDDGVQPIEELPDHCPGH